MIADRIVAKAKAMRPDQLRASTLGFKSAEERGAGDGDFAAVFVFVSVYQRNQ